MTSVNRHHLSEPGATESSYIVNVQAHDFTGYPNNGSIFLDEGGQILLMTPSTGAGKVLKVSGIAKAGPLAGLPALTNQRSTT